MVAVICPLALLPIGSGGYRAKPAIEGQDTEDMENEEDTATLLVSPHTRFQKSSQALTSSLDTKDTFYLRLDHTVALEICQAWLSSSNYSM